MEVKDKKPNIIAIIGAVILLVLAVVGLSYAFFSAYIKGSETDTSIEGTGAKLSLVYADGKSVITSSNIMPGWSATKTFTVTNNGEADTYYKLKISNITNAFVEGGLTFSIASSDGGTSVTEQAVGTTTRTITNSIAIAQGKTHTYTVTAKYINLNKDQTPDLGKSFSYTIGIEASNLSAPEGWQEASKGTLLYNLKEDNEVVVTQTIPGQQVSASSESVLASTDDDYGTSYYFRGSVKNNYVEFANMCWRIVRITGNGNIKIVLHNSNGISTTQSTPSSTTPCSSGNVESAFLKYDTNEMTSPFTPKNNNSSDNAYIGMMYGKENSSSYSETHKNLYKNDIMENLLDWYYNVIAAGDFNNYLGDTIRCNDKSTFAKYKNGTICGTNLGYGENKTCYSGLYRLIENEPSLICPNDNDGGTLSKFTAGDSKGNGALEASIGLLTSDEVIFAGGKYMDTSQEYYLAENSTQYAWWTSTPAENIGSNGIIAITYPGYLSSRYAGESNAIRPALVLKSTVKVLEGYGTSSSPYIITYTTK